MEFMKARALLLAFVTCAAVAIGLNVHLGESASTPGPDDEVFAMQTQSTGNLILGGRFRGGLLRLHSDGSLDESFTSTWSVGGFNGAVRAVLVLDDDSVVVAGEFTSFDQTLAGHILKLNPNGEMDSAFASTIGTGFDDAVYSLSMDSRGRIAVGGSFDSMNGIASSRLILLDSSGRVAWSAPPEMNGSGAVLALSFDKDGQLWFGTDSEPHFSQLILKQ